MREGVHVGRSLNILFSCVGRRVSLLEGFRRAMADLGVRGHVYGADWSPLAPAFHRVDEGFLVSGVNSPNYVDDLVDVCRRKKIDLVIPLIDWELQVLAEARERFQEAGARMLVSSPRVVETCRDKRKTCEFLVKSGLDAPRVFSYEEAADGPFPLFVKPRFGSSTRHVRFVPNRQALKRFGQHTSRFIIQECVRGTEFTVDVYAGLDGVPRVAVPRERLQVRAGEVTKGRTVRHAEIIRKSMQAVEALAECVGVITLQCFLTAEGAIKFFDLNPRFGGGVPLSIEAGADFPRWIIQEHFGERPEIDPEGWQAGLVMLRYDAEVFCKAKDVGMA
jgi:carbamoyl-phosphate synthase large subunit